MLCGWEGNRRSGIAPAMCHRLQWFIHIRAHGLKKHTPTFFTGYGTLPLPLLGLDNGYELGLGYGGVMVRVLARNTKGRGFDSRPFHFQVTTLGKLFIHMCLCHQTV